MPTTNAQRRHYQDNKADYWRRAAESKLKTRSEMQEYKSNTPCTDCGLTYPYYVMDFDHVRGEKIQIIQKLVAAGATAKLREELKKVELVCSNCHRERTYQRSLIDKAAAFEAV
jgi:hypothetical protein